MQAVERWQVQGLVIDEDPAVIGGALRAVTMLMLHKDDIGADLYPQVLDLIIRLIAEGLANSAERNTFDATDKPTAHASGTRASSCYV
ncbi:hypothetical protein HC891_07110 [Candidatus Gracilibacteria bacterium]|nr:hypothetical protein [Candidatus Gracilibacteria bacterium]